jgi:hypothetical protein
VALWNVTLCCSVDRYRGFGGVCCLHQGRSWRQKVPMNHWYLCTQSMRHHISEDYSLGGAGLKAMHYVLHFDYCGAKRSWLQIQRSWFDSRTARFSWEVVGLGLGTLSLVSTIEELIVRNSSGSGLENQEYSCGEPSH